MLDLKSVYLYFLSIKKITIKTVRGLFFSTYFYNNRLLTESPSRFFFYPNPYLLSPFLNHREHLLKISKFEANYFWSGSRNKSDIKNLHSFLWLNLIDRKNDKESMRKIINDWIKNYGNYKREIWDENILSKRVIAWISNADLFLDKKEDKFHKFFTTYLIKQVNFLKRNLNIVSYETTKISCLASIILSGLVFKEYYLNYNLGIRELKKIIDNFFDKNGFPKNRNPESLTHFLQYFIIIKEWIQNAQEEVPEYLNEIIDKNLICLNSLKNESKNLPLFNGSTEKNLDSFFIYLSKLNYVYNKKSKFVGQIQIIKTKKNTLYFDSGEPPIYEYSKDYQSGPLSFEYFHEGDKIITNCGYGRKISKKTQLISKFTSAQSTLCLNDTSVVKFQRNNLINKTFGSTISDGFKISDFSREENKNETCVVATHNAYLNKFGYLHRRQIKILKKSGEVNGEDTLIKKENVPQGLKFSIRFHIYPGVSAIKTMSGQSILLQINQKKSWMLVSNGYNLEIEKGLFMGRNRIVNNDCAVIYGNTNQQDTCIKWELKRSI